MNTTKVEFPELHVPDLFKQSNPITGEQKREMEEMMPELLTTWGEILSDSLTEAYSATVPDTMHNSAVMQALMMTWHQEVLFTIHSLIPKMFPQHSAIEFTKALMPLLVDQVAQTTTTVVTSFKVDGGHFVDDE